MPTHENKRQYRVLGLDVGNAKLKALYLEAVNGQAQRCVWDSLPIPVSEDRALDFEMYLPLQLLQFFSDHDIAPEALDYVSVCCSHSFGFDPYSASIRHLVRVLQRCFAHTPVALVSADGQLTTLKAVAALHDADLYAYVFTNFYGSAWLGSQCIENGLSLDMGTTTLDIIPIRNGRVDPSGLGHAALDPAAAAPEYLQFRYHQDRIHWLGMTVTPLEKLCQRVSYAGNSYQVVPRNYRTDNLFSCLNDKGDAGEAAERELLKRHAYGQYFPSAEAAHRALAESIGLDRYLLSVAGAEAVQQVFLEALIEKTATAMERVLRSEFGTPSQWRELKVAAFALGAERVVIPALRQLGFEEHQWVTLDYQRTQGLWSASSVFAMAVLALEHIGGKLHWR